MSEEMHYPNLIPCRIIVNGSGGSSKPPVRLPAACLAAAQEPELAPVYDFALGELLFSPRYEKLVPPPTRARQ